MRKHITLFFLLITIEGLAQNDKSLTVSFEKLKDTIHTSSSQSYYITKIKIPKQTAFSKPTILFSVDPDKTNVKDLMLPTELTHKITDTSKDSEVTFKVAFTRDTKNDRTLVFRVKAKDEKGNDIKLTDDKSTTAEIYVKPFGELENNDNEYWFFVGTNVDLLDGVKAKDLYFRGSFLIPLSNNEPRKHQFYITFEKNRFFRERDSLYRIPFSDIVFKPGQPDSITVARGQYNSFREIVTENLGFSFSYLRNIMKPSNNYNFYAMAGFYIDYQTNTYNYTNHSILSDTSTHLRKKDSSYIFRPLLTKDRTNSWNSNLYLGFMYIHSGSSVNLKTFLQSGLNILRYPSSRIKTSTTEMTKYNTNKNLYIRFHIDATLVESPGVSLGGEVYLRAGEMPLFNFTITKVIDYRQIKTLFSKTPSQSN